MESTRIPGNGVHPNVVLGVLNGRRARETNQAGLRVRVGVMPVTPIIPAIGTVFTMLPPFSFCNSSLNRFVYHPAEGWTPLELNAWAEC